MNSVNPSVTAVVTTYNRPQLVRRAIRSVLAQTYKPSEIIVVEDGTESGVETWLQQEGYSAVQYICHEHNKGLATARNTGLEQASGDYIAYLDDDDLWKPDRIAKQVRLLSQLSASQQEKTGVIYCIYETRYSSETVVANGREYNSGLLRESIIKQEKLTTPPSSFLFKKTALQEVGGFDEQLISSIDHDIWMALANADYHAYYIDDPLVINSKEGQGTMVTNTAPRILGVLQFSEKWRPVFREWIGKDRGDEFVDQYVARVLAKLAGEKAEGGEWKDAAHVFAESFKQPAPFIYNLRVQTDSVCRGIVRRFVSRPTRRKIKQAISSFYQNGTG